MEYIGKYILGTHEEPDMALRKFSWRSDEQHQAILEWTWPSDVRVKLMLVFPIDETEGEKSANSTEKESGEPDIANLLWWGHEHTVVSRALASRFVSPIQGERQRYMICPAYFNEENTVVVYKPAQITDWIYKKNRVEAKALYKPLRLSRYKQVSLDVVLPADSPEPGKALRYGIYENNRLIGVYPLDNDIIEGKYTINIRKNQQVKFLVDDEHSNRFEFI